jgi:hypothetical protein
MPDLNQKRSTAGSFISSNGEFLYIFNGYAQINFNKEIVKSVERINLSNMVQWEIIPFQEKDQLNLASFAMYTVPYDQSNLLILGGWDPKETDFVNKIRNLDLSKMEIAGKDLILTKGDLFSRQPIFVMG